MGQLGRQNAPQPFDVYKKDEVYSKTEQDITDNAQDSVDALKANAADVYTKTEVNNLPADSFKNKLINGGFDVWQRGTSNTTGGFFADRWNARLQVDVGGSYSITKENIHVAGKAYTVMNVNITGATGQFYFYQKCEDIRNYGNKTITISFFASSAVPVSFDIIAYSNYGTGGSTQTSVAVGTVNITSTWTKHTFTFDVPTADGKTIGDSSYLQILFNNSNVVDYSSLKIGETQLEEGSIATPFENRPIGVELALCQRYFETSYGDGQTLGQATATGMSIFQSGTANNALKRQFTKYSVAKRGTPTLQSWDSLGAAAKIDVLDPNNNIVTSGALNVFGNSSSFTMINNAGNSSGMRFHWSADAEL